MLQRQLQSDLGLYRHFGQTLVRFIHQKKTEKKCVKCAETVVERGTVGKCRQTRSECGSRASFFTSMLAPRPLPRRQEILVAVSALLLSCGNAAPRPGPKTLSIQVRTPCTSSACLFPGRGCRAVRRLNLKLKLRKGTGISTLSPHVITLSSLIPQRYRVSRLAKLGEGLSCTDTHSRRTVNQVQIII
jgi:hypothetical protein